MQIVCPCCHARHPLDAALADEAARAAVARAAALGGELPRLAIVYLGLFRPPGRVLSWSRACRLLDVLVEAVEAGEIRRRGRRWHVTRAEWAQALALVIERRDAGRLDTPLKDHAYLFEVARGLADRTEAAAERAVEAARRTRSAVDASGAVPAADYAQRYEALLDEARRLGVECDAQGLVRPLTELAEAVRAAQLQEQATQGDAA